MDKNLAQDSDDRSSYETDVYDDILCLNGKLKSLKAEVVVKMEGLALQDDTVSMTQKKQLTILLEDLSKAISTITILVDTLNSDNLKA